jgi:hypothetical protein
MRWRIGAAIAGAVGALAYLAQTLVGFDLALWLKILLASGGTGLLFFSIALPNWQVAQEARARKAALATANEAVAAYDIKVHKVLVPLSGLLGKVIAASEKERRALQERLKQFVIDSALDNMQGTDPRSCFYAVEENPHRRLVLDGAWRERNTRPREEFKTGDDAGNEALRILDDRETKFVRDTDKQPPPGWTQDRDYKTYIQVAVASGTKPYGLLCVDAVNPGDLTDIDRRHVELLAQRLGCALGAN